MSGITQDWWYWYSSLMVASVLIASLQDRVFAQITPDNTLPKNSSVARDGNTFNITGGTQAGSNLFHSFREFSVPNGGTASFNNAGDIQNIITRVTGGSISNIDGLIRANGTANLFLLNPNGIIFGANARLDIGGSFLATTASSFKWSDGSTFSATNPQPPSKLLAINPSALFFNQLQAAKIENRSTTNAGNNLKGLRVPDGRSLLLVGGDIVLDGGSLNALGGLVELAGVSGNGTVGLNVDSQDLSLSVPDDVPRADISLSNGAVVDVRAGGEGSITVNARNLDLKQQSQLVAGIKSGLGTATATAGDIKINATDTVFLDNSLVNSTVEKNGEGKAGGVSITTGSLEVTNGALLSASTFGKGDAGSVTISARDTIKFDGEAKKNRSETGAYSRVYSGAEGNAGGVSITTGSLEVTNGALLSASNFGGKGNAGSVTISASDTIKFDGKGKGQDGYYSGAYSQVRPGAEGNAGGVSITTGSLEVTNGAQLSASTLGKGDAGSVSIFARDAIKFDGEANDGSYSAAYSEVIFGAEGKAGGVSITTSSLEVTNGAQLSASTLGKGDAGSVSIFARDAIKFDGEANDGFDSGAYSRVYSGAEGKAGGVLINTSSLEVTNGALLSASTFGKGNAGSVNITADTIKFDGEGRSLNSGAYSRVIFGAEGNAGGVSIRTGSLEVTNGALLSADTFGKGDAGSVTISATDTIKFDGEDKHGLDSGAFSEVKPGAEGKAGGVLITTGSLEVTNGAVLSASTVGKGDAGSVIITATDAIKFDGEGKNKDGFDSGAYSRVYSGAEGNAGGVSITTGSLEVTNGALLSASTFGKGDAGSVSITARDTIKFDGEGSKDRFNSGAYSRVFYGAEGNAGGVSIRTGSLEVTNGAQLDANTFGKGDAGSVTITATDAIKFDGEGSKYEFDSGAFSEVKPGAEGKAGGVSITTGSLEITNGARLDASTLGKGDAGSVTITATDAIKFDGEGKDGSDSGAYSRVYPGAEGKAGGVSITTGSLEVTNGARLDASTEGKGDAGSVSIFANTFEASNGGQVSTITSGKSNAGNITFQVKDNITLSGLKTGLFASTSEGSIGNGGNIIIDPRIMTIRDGAVIAVDSQGEGTGGNIQLAAGFLKLERGTISAATRSNTGGNITLNVQELLSLRDRSQITTNAGVEQFGGDGGNITINALNGFILAVPSENSDITANAYKGKGGIVEIQANGIYGIEFRESPTPLSDITASSEFGRQGTVELNTPYIGPNNGLVQLPTIPVDTQVAQGCYSPDYAQNRFVIAGRGGLPMSPTEPLQDTSTLSAWVRLRPKPANAKTTISPQPIAVSNTTKVTVTTIVEATGWVVNRNGNVELVAQVPGVTPHSSWQTPASCPASR
ncbi:filamentous hemagglutinin N-terminal domain-containing protein [Nostoc sp. CHAB 5784]|uniref:two-partner secretion domain-containing protein n=1 Tax=Nostoc mirabile TaxID=2907820 RepID=UPI001E2C80E7|nr:filamentous hemagglutinin N-terminal domain-containing protein [Nostoc mirabile]MCC5667919.1 filamentous hemagglutinin N-terminal domain-containing protein [Nostoc mirabile CHAB5784]